MAELTAEQKQTVSEWAEAGATLNDIQSRLKAEFGLAMTYMEARLLMTELEVRLKDKSKPEPAPEAKLNAASEEPERDDPAGFDEAMDGDLTEEEKTFAESPAGQGGGAFVMEADEIMVPGTLVSGSATFSDGVKAKWFLDQMGRLSLKADKPSYQPPPADVPKFQQQLEKILIKLGMY